MCLRRTPHLALRLQETKETTWQRPGTAPVKDAAGNVYDDETTQDDGPDFSNSMRQKMIDESRGFGADPGSKQRSCPTRANRSATRMALPMGFGAAGLLS